MHHLSVSSKAICVSISLAAVYAIPPVGSAIAAPQRLDCNLTTLETKQGQKFDSVDENRSIIITIDKDAKLITIDSGGDEHTLQNVTVSVTSMNGFDDKFSLGIDTSSLSIVMQKYQVDSMLAEFGSCKESLQPPR